MEPLPCLASAHVPREHCRLGGEAQGLEMVGRGGEDELQVSQRSDGVAAP